VFAGDGPAIDANAPRSELGVPEAQRRPFFDRFGWTQGINYFCNCADNRYNAMQAKFETRFSDLNILAHYTLSAARNYDDNYFIHNRDIGYGPTSFDRKHVFLFSEVWDLPIGRNKRFLSGTSRVVDTIIGGWQINSITTWMSGLPFTPSVSGANCSVNAGPCRPDRIGDPDPGDRDQNQWFAGGIGPGTPWAKAAEGQFGNAGRNSLRGPTFLQTDFSLFKNFRLSEGTKLEFRAEAFNIFNKVNLGQPNSEVDSANVGQITSLAPNIGRMRQWQFGLRLTF
jgi:hypothetical protein